MSQRIELASGHVENDPLRVELVQVAPDIPAVCIVRWPVRPTQVTPAKLADAVATACRILANASVELAARRSGGR